MLDSLLLAYPHGQQIKEAPSVHLTPAGGEKGFVPTGLLFTAEQCFKKRPIYILLYKLSRRRLRSFICGKRQFSCLSSLPALGCFHLLEFRSDSFLTFKSFSTSLVKEAGNLRLVCGVADDGEDVSRKGLYG